MTFEYLQRIVVEGELDVENIGDCVIQANNDLSEEWYLITKTLMGQTEVFEYGPIVPDISLLPPNYQIKYSRIEYSQPKLEKIIDKFLNDSKRGITQAKITDLMSILNNLVNPIDRLLMDKGRTFDE